MRTVAAPLNGMVQIVGFKPTFLLEPVCEDNYSYQIEPTPNKAKIDGARRPADATLKNDICDHHHHDNADDFIPVGIMLRQDQRNAFRANHRRMSRLKPEAYRV